MTYFEDLSPYTYDGKNPRPYVLNIGWLGKESSFAIGLTSEAFRSALRELCDNHVVNLHRGFHECEFCPIVPGNEDPDRWRTRGNGQVRVRNASGTWYVAPRLIAHYVEDHNYLPPQDFISTVLSPGEIGTSITIDREHELHDKFVKSLPPIDVDEIVRRELREERKRKNWWRLW